MHTSYGLCGVKKGKCICVGCFNKPNFGQPCIANTILISSRLHSKPLYPQEVHSLQRFIYNTHMWRRNKCMENTYHVCVPERFCIRSSFGGLDHDIRVWARMFGVCVASDVVCHIVDIECATSVDAFPCYTYGISFFICKLAICISIIASLK